MASSYAPPPWFQGILWRPARPVGRPAGHPGRPVGRHVPLDRGRPAL